MNELNLQKLTSNVVIILIYHRGFHRPQVAVWICGWNSAGAVAVRSPRDPVHQETAEQLSIVKSVAVSRERLCESRDETIVNNTVNLQILLALHRACLNPARSWSCSNQTFEPLQQGQTATVLPGNFSCNHTQSDVSTYNFRIQSVYAAGLRFPTSDGSVVPCASLRRPGDRSSSSRMKRHPRISVRDRTTIPHGPSPPPPGPLQ